MKSSASELESFSWIGTSGQCKGATRGEG